MKAKYFLLFLAIALILPSISAVYLDNSVIINTTGSNSSMTFSIPINCDSVTIEKDNITLTNIICPDGYDLNEGSIIFFNTNNYNKDSNTLCITDFDGGCKSMLSVFVQYPILIGLIGTIFFIGLGILVLLGLSKVDMATLDTQSIILGFAVIIGIGLLIISAIVIVSSICI